MPNVARVDSGALLPREAAFNWTVDFIQNCLIRLGAMFAFGCPFFSMSSCDFRQTQKELQAVKLQAACQVSVEHLTRLKEETCPDDFDGRQLPYPSRFSGMRLFLPCSLLFCPEKLSPTWLKGLQRPLMNVAHPTELPTLYLLRLRHIQTWVLPGGCYEVPFWVVYFNTS